MKKTNILLLILLSTSLLVCSCKSHKKYADEKSVTWYDLVTGEKVKHTFKIKNIYSQVIEIGSYYTEYPGSVTASFEKRKLVPGESTEMEVEFDTLGFFGKKTTKLLVYHTNAPNEKPMEFTINAIIKNFVFSKPQTIVDYGNILNPASSGIIKSIELEILPLKIEERLNVTKVDAGEFNFISYEIKEYKNGKKVVLQIQSEKLINALKFDIVKEKQKFIDELTGVSRPSNTPFYTVEQNNSVTQFRIPVTIHTSHPIQKTIRYVLVGKIFGNINANFPASGIPFTGIMNRLDKGVNFSQDVDFKLFEREKKPFKILNIESTNELITVKYEQKTPYEFKIVLTFNKDKKLIKSLKLNRGYVIIETDSPYSRLLHIPFQFVW